MKEERKKIEQLVRELEDLRKRAAELEKSDVERRQLSVRLQDSEARWRSLVENAADLILTIDKEGIILFMNRTPPGLTVPEVIGKSSYDFIGPEHWDMVKTAVAGVFSTGNPDQYEIWARGPHNTLAWYSTRVAPVIKDGAVTAVSVIARDITKRKQAEEALRKSEKQYRDLVNNSPVGIYTTNIKGDILFVNEALARMAGYGSPAELMEKGVLATYKHGSDRDLLLKTLREQGKISNFEFEFVRKNGDTIRASLSAVLEGELLSGMILDITERKQAEEERERLILDLKEALAKIKTLSGMLPICSSCKKIRNDSGYWQQIEVYICDHSEAEFTHGICPDCMEKLYGEYKKE
jgi:PAS domain S-box-containing protein